MRLLVMGSRMQSSRRAPEFPQTGVGRQPGMAAAAARPATTGDAGTGQKGLFGWCRKLGKLRQVASGAHEEQDDGAEQVSSPLITADGAVPLSARRGTHVCMA